MSHLGLQQERSNDMFGARYQIQGYAVRITKFRNVFFVRVGGNDGRGFYVRQASTFLGAWCLAPEMVDELRG